MILRLVRTEEVEAPTRKAIMPGPIPIDSNESMQRARSATSTTADASSAPAVMPVIESSISCPPFPPNIPLIPEGIAEQVRLGNFAAFFAWITYNPPLPYYFSTTISTVPLVALCNSATAASSNGIATFRLLDLTCPVDGAFHYAGTNPPPPPPPPTTTEQTSIPGVTVPPELKTLPAPPDLPVMPAIAPLDSCFSLSVVCWLETGAARQVETEKLFEAEAIVGAHTAATPAFAWQIPSIMDVSHPELRHMPQVPQFIHELKPTHPLL